MAFYTYMVRQNFPLPNISCVRYQFLRSAYTIYCKSFEVEKFRGFCGSISTMKLFQWNSLCSRLWPCKTTVQPRKFSSKRKFSSATAKLFHLQRFAICGMIKNHLEVYGLCRCPIFKCPDQQVYTVYCYLNPTNMCIYVYTVHRIWHPFLTCMYTQITISIQWGMYGMTSNYIHVVMNILSYVHSKNMPLPCVTADFRVIPLGGCDA